VSLPLIIWLHGAGEMGYQPGGTPLNFINTGFPKVLREWSKTNLKPIPAIAIAPQTNGEWGYTDAHFETIKVGIEYALSKYNIDKSNIVLMGHSWGGRGTINISYAMQKKYSHNYFSAIVTMSPVYVDGPYPQKEQEGSYNYFSKMKIRGYSEYSKTNGFFDWLNKSDEYFYMKNINHSDIPYKSLSIDDNNDGVSDLMYWLFGEAANFK
jgi:pimeloyl-ACP methyl ester carboxylesterase